MLNTFYAFRLCNIFNVNDKSTFVYNVIDNRGKKRDNKSMYVINKLTYLYASNIVKKISQRILSYFIL